MIEFTRYLYIKQDVETALIGSLLNKDKDLALFWAFELFHSGFTQGALLVLWNAYYGFYATESPAMEAYMKKREATMDPEEFIVTFVSNLVIRPSNTDVFFLSGAAQKTEEDDDYVEWDLTKRLEEKNYEAIAHALVSMSKEKSKLTKAKKQLSTYFESKGMKRPTFAVTCDHVAPSLILIARTMTYYAQLAKSTNEKKKNLYVVAGEGTSSEFRTIEVNYPDEKPPKLFPKLAKHSPETNGILSVFMPSHSNETLDTYRGKWIIDAYHTTPIWRKRVEEYGGKYSKDDGDIVWDNVDNEEEFWERYYYDTDEQPMEIQRKNIPSYNARMTMQQFCDTYKKSGLYTPCPELLEALTD